ncbi:MAG TPA: thiol:disulfide interchange protein DsbA/DsbL [Solimonas sp.]
MRGLLRGAIAALTLLTFACSAQEGSPQFQSGKQYKPVREAQKPADSKRIEVAEFFWYGCPHCYAFDPFIEKWAHAKPADVDFVRYPSTLGRPEGQLHARAFYTAEALNVFPKMHPALFAAIHDRHQRLDNEAQIAAVFNRETGILPDVFTSTFKGFAVDSRARRAEQLAVSYGLTSVPVIVVGGKYYTSAAMAGGYEQSLQVVNFLVEKVRKERGGK